jgi:outer membrane protein OmpA-like peptidoglycan-associated protein
MQKRLRHNIINLLCLSGSLLISISAIGQDTLATNLTVPYDSSEDADNIVFNSSFEQYVECPRKVDAHGILTTVQAWYQPTSGSADYYNVCGARECGIPKNKLGVQFPHSGNGMCGIYCSKTDYREYLQTQLKRPLQAGQTYQLTFYVSLSEYSAGAVATIGGLLSVDKPEDTGMYTLMKKETRAVSSTISQTIATYYTPQVQNDYFHVLSNTVSWTKISGTFVAEGGERYLTIGNFLPAGQSNVTDIETLTYLLPGAYYYVDDVSLVCLTCKDSVGEEEKYYKSFTQVVDNGQTASDENKPLTIVNASDSAFQVGATFILNDIYFDFDKSVLLQQSYVELQGLLQVLSRYPKMKIEIGGHTDGYGSADYNQRLSESRAHAVVDYLINKGIDQRRLQYKGYGKSKPIDTNDTDEGRARNRRVEFIILSM